MSIKQQIIDALEKLIERYEAGADLSAENALCGYLGGEITYGSDELDTVIDDCFINWPGFSGNNTFPVWTDKTISPGNQYDRCWNYYKGEYGAARIDLARFIVAKLREEVGHEN